MKQDFVDLRSCEGRDGQ